MKSSGYTLNEIVPKADTGTEFFRIGWINHTIYGNLIDLVVGTGVRLEKEELVKITDIHWMSAGEKCPPAWGIFTPDLPDGVKTVSLPEHVSKMLEDYFFEGHEVPAPARWLN